MNLQNIPAQKEYRAAFTATPGWKIVGSDYSGMELRLLSEFSGDTDFAKIFTLGLDPHCHVASMIYRKLIVREGDKYLDNGVVKIAPKDVNADLRRVGKNINFGMKRRNAEEKLVKLGETLTDNADGNPERSFAKEERVETGRRVCKKCSEVILDNRRKRFCSDLCSNRFFSHANRVKKGLIQKPGVGSGGNQIGEDNYKYKNNIGNYSKLAFAILVNECDKCRSVDNLLTHHRDHDRTNNDISNLVIWCKKCHQNYHCYRDLETGRYIKGQSTP